MNKILGLVKKIFLENNLKIFITRCLIGILLTICFAKACTWLLTGGADGIWVDILFYGLAIVICIGVHDSEGNSMWEFCLPKYKIDD